MGWFDEQIRERKQYDDEAFSEAFANMASAVMGKRISAAVSDDRRAAKDAIDDILKHYHIKSREIPDSISDVNEQLEYLLRPYGIMRRTVRLEDGTPSARCWAFFGRAGRPWRLFPGGFPAIPISTPRPAEGSGSTEKTSICSGRRPSSFISRFL